MPTVSIKLTDEIKQRVNAVAAAQGIKPHALMVRSIESSLAQAEHHQSFVANALRARASASVNGLVMDGPAYASYLRAKVRGSRVKRPALQTIDALLSDQLGSEHVAARVV